MKWLPLWGKTKRLFLTDIFMEDDEVELRRERLNQFCRRIIIDLDEQPNLGVTHCNRALRAAAVEIAGYTYFHADQLMNDMIIQIEKTPEFKKASLKEGWEWANYGGWAVVCKKYAVHGHGATIAPSEKMFDSPSFGLVPFCANVGKTNGIAPVSLCFPVLDGIPDCYCYSNCWGH